MGQNHILPEEKNDPGGTRTRGKDYRRKVALWIQVRQRYTRVSPPLPSPSSLHAISGVFLRLPREIEGGSERVDGAVGRRARGCHYVCRP